MTIEYRTIPAFPGYLISNTGEVINKKTDRPLAVSYTQSGVAKVSLYNEDDPSPFTRGVAKLVAEIFLGRPQISNAHVIHLDFSKANCNATNLAWRPRHFAWHYARQHSWIQWNACRDILVRDLATQRVYTMGEACKTFGLLIDDVMNSADFGRTTYPTDQRFEHAE